MHADFLIGPAGTGKTWRCLSEIRAALRTDSRLPLLMLAPKQATFQLERQLLATGEITAYARLQIVSFERFAEMILENLTGSPPRLVGEEGRRMVLRAILMDRLHDLTLFHASARLPGFARHLSDLFRLLQRSKIPPSRLTELAQQAGAETALGRKLSDLSLLLSSYIEWLTERRIEDEVRLMDFAAAALRAAPPETFRIGGLWMDGFAELTPQELELLGAVLPRCERATLAFCVPEAFEQEPGWNSGWAIAGQTFLRCWQRVTQVEKLDAKVTRLNLDVQSPTRFLDNPALLHLAGNWMLRHPQVFPGDMPGRVRCVACSSLEAECILAAREVLEWVRSGGRFKELAVTVRSLEPYHAAISRVFTRYGVPFFMDRRETASHHPVAEFTRSAFRIAALGWRHDDVFSALKSGMTGIRDHDVDWLEEASLRLGWDGCSWEADLPSRGDKKIDGDRVGSLRLQVVPTLCRFVSELTRCGDPGPSGIECAASLRRLWGALDIEGQLRKWAEVGRVEWGQADRVHLTVWQQVSEWLDSFELAFENRRMPLSHWLPIVESGLSGLTVGVIPPALDQVLVGSIDRSRNPELKKMLVLGMNEGVFPAVPASSVLLTQRERESMAELDRLLGPGQRHQIGHEWYLAYAALTRASREVVISWAETGTDGEVLHPSLFVSKLQAMFPSQPTERFDDSTQDGAWVHVREGLPLLLRLAAAGGERARQAVERSAGHGCDWRHQVRLKSMMTSELLSSSVAAQLYGNPLKTSVSALEDFAACPFKF
ncbi:MAG: hypothetical protein FJ405_11885, partial [Verrucomicrobia bacterium]|nr:hypothetical protein [Verrucomicrobiota bacterium]